MALGTPVEIAVGKMLFPCIRPDNPTLSVETNIGVPGDRKQLCDSIRRK
jgi:hypothetical protein